MVEPSGFLKVMDFGIARLAVEPAAAADRATLTAAGSVVGSPDYMAPEQMLGEEVDARTDIYSAGAVLFECLTGRRVFEGATVYDLLRKHLEHAPTDPREIVPEVPEPLARAVLKALAKEPKDRWPSALAFHDALAELA
ncbi:MAG: serine/threonine-protein kinase [Gemmatimonadota bacterium]